VADLGIEEAPVPFPPPRKDLVSWHAGKTDVSSSSLPVSNPASSGISALNANPTTVLLTTSAPYAAPKITPSPPKNVSNFKKIVTPLNADGFDILLHHYNLTSRYPTLSLDLRNGFSLGEFDQHLLESYDHPNHKNALPHVDRIASYIQDEVAGGRMSGPFTWDQLKKEARGNIIVSPLGAVDKAGEPGKLRITCDLSFKGKAPFSVNNKIDKDAFKTKWGTAAMVIDLVSPLLLFRPIYSSATKALFAVITSCIGKRMKFLVFMQHA
jgi:hypothetical protein